MRREEGDEGQFKLQRTDGCIISKTGFTVSLEPDAFLDCQPVHRRRLHLGVACAGGTCA